MWGEIAYPFINSNGGYPVGLPNDAIPDQVLPIITVSE